MKFHRFGNIESASLPWDKLPASQRNEFNCSEIRESPVGNRRLASLNRVLTAFQEFHTGGYSVGEEREGSKLAIGRRARGGKIFVLALSFESREDKERNIRRKRRAGS